jgi:hypothetical protein
MQVLITEAQRTEHGTYVQTTCENTNALVAIYPRGLQICCQNAAHKVWRKSGRHFRDLAEALQHYKSAEMRAR